LPSRYVYRVSRSDKAVTIKPPLPSVAQKVNLDKATTKDVIVPTGREDYSSYSKAELAERADAAGLDSYGTKADLVERLSANK
jgi:hypothetical protein